MSALVDIAPAFADVKVSDTDIRQHGLTAAQIAKLLIRFPGLFSLLKEIQELFADGEDAVDIHAAIAQIDHVTMAKLGGDAIGAIISYSTGDDDDPKAEAVAAQLPAGTQIVFLKNALKLSFPNGFSEAMETVALAA